MTELNLKILDLINENKSLKEMSSILGLSEKQLYIRIRQIINYGYSLEPNYTYDSDIYYKINTRNISKISDNNITINVPTDLKQLRCIAISDLHIGNINSNIDLLKKVYDYAAKNNIHVIFNCGDLLEGMHTCDKRNINSIYDQIEYVIQKYPYDESINNYLIFGNHDYHAFYHNGLDVSKKIENSRHDIVSLGFGQGIVNIKKEKILLQHELCAVDLPKIEDDVKLALVGHGHMMKTKVYDTLLLCLPSLSYVCPDKTKENIPSFVDIELHFTRDNFEFIRAKQMLVEPSIAPISESRCRMKVLQKH